MGDSKGHPFRGNQYTKGGMAKISLFAVKKAIKTPGTIFNVTERRFVRVVAPSDSYGPRASPVGFAGKKTSAYVITGGGSRFKRQLAGHSVTRLAGLSMDRLGPKPAKADKRVLRLARMAKIRRK